LNEIAPPRQLNRCAPPGAREWNMTLNRRALLILIIIGVLGPTVSGKPKDRVTARVFIAECLESANLAVPINRSDRRKQTQIGGGAQTIAPGLQSKRCDYRYDLFATRIDRNRVKLSFAATIGSKSVEKEITLTRGQNIDLQLDHGVRLVARF
jgi:hypothetical protein